MTMKRTFARLVAALIVGIPSLSPAAPIAVSYEIGPYGPVDGFWASWLHDADHCGGAGPDSGATLWKCSADGSKAAVTGTLSGTLDGGIFTVKTGALLIDGIAYGIGGGTLGGTWVDGAYLDPPSSLNWHLVVNGLGTFYFESMSMGSSGPNQYDADGFVLWGQNLDAYNDCSGRDCLRWGIDLYGKRVPVPEPGTLALFGLGLMAMTMIARRRRAVCA